MKSLFSTLALGLALMATPAMAGEKTAKIAVSELSCPSCVYIVSTSMKSVPTVKVVDFLQGEDWWKGVFTVTYDDEAATTDMIIEAVFANGYPAALLHEDGS
jgi:periplasmic mercuric ion binding protein